MKSFSHLANGVGEFQNVGFGESDAHNCIRTKRLNLIGACDGQTVINHFRHK